MEVEVDVADTTRHARSPTRRAPTARVRTDAFAHDAEEADALVRETIAANLGGAESRREPPRPVRSRKARAPALAIRTVPLNAVSAKAAAAPL